MGRGKESNYESLMAQVNRGTIDLDRDGPGGEGLGELFFVFLSFYLIPS